MPPRRSPPAPAAAEGDGLFRALADPTRRAMLDLLAEHEPLTVGELAGRFPDLAPSGISKHLMLLRALDLVRATKDGRRRCYRINAPALRETLRPWIAKYEKYWDERLDALREAAEADATRARRSAPR